MLRLFLLLWHIPRALRLTWRLVRDRRVDGALKGIPLFALMYLVWPYDLRPDYIPVVGLLDDAVIVTLALRLFHRLSPPAVVREHDDVLNGRVVEGRYRIVDEPDRGP